MKLNYTGRPWRFAPNEQAKIDAKLSKISKMLEHESEREAHVIVKQERHLTNVEITLRAFDHSLAGAGSSRDLFEAVTGAIEKLEKQILKMRTKWRTTKRHKTAPHRTPEEANAAGEAALALAPKPAPGKKAKPSVAKAKKRAPGTVEVFKANHHNTRKPMTLDEAVLEMGEAGNYLVYRDAATERLSVLLRRPDGHFELVENE